MSTSVTTEISFAVNDFEYGAVWSASVCLCIMSLILNTRVLANFIVYNELKSVKNCYVMGIVVADFISILSITFQTVLAAVENTLGGSYTYCTIYGHVLVPYLRVVTWTTMGILAFRRSREIRNYTSDINEQVKYFRGYVLVVWIMFFICMVPTGIGFLAKTYIDESRCFVIWYKTELKMHTIWGTSQMAFVVIAISYISFVNFKTFCSMKVHQLKDNSRLNFSTTFFLLFVFNIPFMFEQFVYIQTNELIYDTVWTLASFLFSQFSFASNPYFLWCDNEEILRMKCRGINMNPTPRFRVHRPAEDAEDDEEAKYRNLPAWKRFIYEQCAYDVNVPPAQGPREEVAGNLDAHPQDNDNLLPQEQDPHFRMPGPSNINRQIAGNLEAHPQDNDNLLPQEQDPHFRMSGPSNINRQVAGNLEAHPQDNDNLLPQEQDPHFRMPGPSNVNRQIAGNLEAHPQDNDNLLPQEQDPHFRMPGPSNINRQIAGNLEAHPQDNDNLLPQEQDRHIRMPGPSNVNRQIAGNLEAHPQDNDNLLPQEQDPHFRMPGPSNINRQMPLEDSDDSDEDIENDKLNA